MIKIFNAILGVIALLALTACDPQAEGRTQPLGDMQQVPQLREAASPSAQAHRTRLALLEKAKVGSIKGMAEVAAQNPDFLSSPVGEPPRAYWNLLRRTGLDPARKIQRVFEEPPGEIMIDGTVAYVWPDLAAFESEDLIPEKLTFMDRKRLRELVGEEGIARIREGHAYPGIHTAIDAEGRWLYFIFGETSEN